MAVTKKATAPMTADEIARSCANRLREQAKVADVGQIMRGSFVITDRTGKRFVVQVAGLDNDTGPH